MLLRISATDPFGEKTRSPISSNRFDRTGRQRFFASSPLGFVLRLLAYVGVPVFERTQEVFGSRVAADIAIDTG